ncbi:helix-turn-helix domain-containing protein [Muribacter muris]|uniref:helix-turn-helix domain-containing protein n=1 Tax=Muribacter muris TaxID=67855 RepID=UPI00064DD9B8|nr:helix-turn-helix domain-containing protein [Muribacter muris]
MSNFSSGEVIERLLKIYSLKTMKELSAELGFSNGVVANWNARNSIPLDVLLNVAEQKKVSLDWLIRGEQPTNELSTHEKLVLMAFNDLDDRKKLEVIGLMTNLKADKQQSANGSINVIGNQDNYIGGDVKIG